MADDMTDTITYEILKERITELRDNIRAKSEKDYEVNADDVIAALFPVCIVDHSKLGAFVENPDAGCEYCVNMDFDDENKQYIYATDRSTDGKTVPITVVSSLFNALCSYGDVLLEAAAFVYPSHDAVVVVDDLKTAFEPKWNADEMKRRAVVILPKHNFYVKFSAIYNIYRDFQQLTSLVSKPGEHGDEASYIPLDGGFYDEASYGVPSFEQIIFSMLKGRNTQFKYQIKIGDGNLSDELRVSTQGGSTDFVDAAAKQIILSNAIDVGDSITLAISIGDEPKTFVSFKWPTKSAYPRFDIEWMKK